MLSKVDRLKELLFDMSLMGSGYCQHLADVGKAGLDDCDACLELALTALLGESGIMTESDDFVEFPLTVVSTEMGRDQRDTFVARSDSAVAEARFVMLQQADKPLRTRDKVLMRVYFD